MRKPRPLPQRGTMGKPRATPWVGSTQDVIGPERAGLRRTTSRRVRETAAGHRSKPEGAGVWPVISTATRRNAKAQGNALGMRPYWIKPCKGGILLVPPLQGLGCLRTSIPGRCPGLSPMAPLGPNPAATQRNGKGPSHVAPLGPGPAATRRNGKAQGNALGCGHVLCNRP